MSVKLLLILGLAIALFFGAGSIYRGFDGWVQTTLSGPEYCFKDIDMKSISIASQGVEVKYTQMEGNILCFRTKDPSIPERINQQVQDRKLQEELARIQANDKFWNETFPLVFLIGAVALVVIFITLIFSNINNGGNY